MPEHHPPGCHQHPCLRPLLGFLPATHHLQLCSTETHAGRPTGAPALSPILCPKRQESVFNDFL